ncbi:hypothetical protein DAPPUDRAFT_311613 [Daphnia pulex]|uniref:AIMP2 thioredoxin-like domain-containing protein n=1 Tax=Daphnia pulex TaxID=6669 RepID=E9FXE3_DAPPU|nr:hypothetical protein DAPPUDRAFT_311613 [Daphnia pulex]|eukprot:EFX88061.1 hypothetical protein DAPPUDRAFT_311613 [Daphnia pulex]
MKKISDHFNHIIAANNDGTGENTQNDATSNNCEVEELEKRWTEITSRLQRLQSELAAIKTGSASELSSFVDAGVRNFQDLVIQASPSNPPHSLPLLKQRMEMLGMSVYARTHVHSTVAGHKLLDDTLKSFVCSDSRVERSKAHVAITLIWIKDDGEEPSLMVSPSSQGVAIKGEANIARYLARLVPGLLDYESQPLKAAQIDHYLDLTECSAPLGARGLKRDRAAALQLLERTLSTNKSLEGSQVGVLGQVVDFVVYSALVNSCTEKEIGTNIRSWMDRCRSTVKKAVN